MLYAVYSTPIIIKFMAPWYTTLVTLTLDEEQVPLLESYLKVPNLLPQSTAKKLHPQLLPPLRLLPQSTSNFRHSGPPIQKSGSLKSRPSSQPEGSQCSFDYVISPEFAMEIRDLLLNLQLRTHMSSKVS